jgi:hypothetical protein
MDVARRFHTVQVRDEQAQFMVKITALLLILMIASGAPIAQISSTPIVPAEPGNMRALVQLPRALTAGHIDAPRPAGVIAFVTLATVIDLLVVLSFVTCICGAVPDWRWRWLLLVLIPIGVGRATLDWMSGQIHFELLGILAPSALFAPGHGLSPRSISMGFPLFALLFWPLRAVWLEFKSANSSR